MTKLVMTWKEWAQADAIALSQGVVNGEFSPREIAHQAREAIRALNPSLDAAREVFDDAVDDPLIDGMNPLGAFRGIPFLMKDLGPTMKGRLQEMGSRFMQGRRSNADSFLTQKIRAAGLNIIGRTSTPEFGVCSSAENPAICITRNPWDTAYSSCGSSAGSTVLVAAGAVPMAHATDGGGSIRIPAGFNGNIGMKCSRGVFSIAPALSDLTGLVSTQGCISRTVRDTAAWIDHCRGGAPGEFMPFWQPETCYSDLIKADPPRLRIALSTRWGPYAAEAGLCQELERSAKHLQDLGHHVDWALPDLDYEKAFEAQTFCYISNFAQVISAHLKARQLKEPPADYIEPINRLIWETGKDFSYSDRFAMQEVFNTTARSFGAFFESWDIMLTPITAQQTPLIGQSELLTTSTETDVYAWFHRLWEAFAFTPLSNLCGIPAISLPMAQQSNGLPFGIQAQAKQANDGLLLQVAAQIERSLAGRWNQGQKPKVHVQNLGR
jgi:amidase